VLTKQDRELLRWERDINADNYHACIQYILQSFKDFQGNRETSQVKDQAWLQTCFPLAFIISASLSQDKCVDDIMYMPMYPRFVRHVISLQGIVTIRLCLQLFSMSDMNELCVNAMQLHKQRNMAMEECGNGSELDTLQEDELKQLKMGAHENLWMYSQHVNINSFSALWFGSNTCCLLECLPHAMIMIFCIVYSCMLVN